MQEAGLRRQQLEADSEEELLRLQEEFLKQSSTPSAKVTRISRPAAASSCSQQPTGADAAVGTSSRPHLSEQHHAASSIRPAAQPAHVALPAHAPGGSVQAAPAAAQPASAPAQQAAAPPAPRAQALQGSAEGPSQAGAGPAAARRAPGGAAGTSQQTSILGSISGVLGDIMERSPAPDAAAPPPPPPSAGAASFPQAAHRKQSKFALSRKSKQQQDVPGAAAGPEGATPSSGAPAAAAAEAADPDPSHMPVAKPTAGAGTASAGAGAAADGPQQQQQQDLERIHAQNWQAVAGMDPGEVSTALEELRSRLDPAKVEFLRRRGAAKLAGTGAGAGDAAPTGRGQRAAVTAGGAPGGRPGRVGRVVAAAAGGRVGLPPLSGDTEEVPMCGPQEAANEAIDRAVRALEGAAAPATLAAPGGAGAASIAAVGGSGTTRPTATTHSTTAAVRAKSAPASAAPGTASSAARRGAAGSDGAAATTSRPGVHPADPRVVARLRFDLGACVVGMQRPDEEFNEEAVLLRDALRRDEGSAPEGYTLGELLLLMRSSVPAQRVAGLTLLAQLLCCARPCAEDLPLGSAAAAGAGAGAGGAPGDGADGRLVLRYVEVPEELQKQSGTAACAVAWQEVWQFYVSELGLAQHLRLALDDERADVAAAAAAALASLVGLSPSESLQGEMADACPATGWPAPAIGYLHRPSAGATWQAYPPVAPPPSAAPGAPGDEGPDVAEDVALVDPLMGLMQMGLMQRIRYLLTSHASPALALPLLAVVCACARAGAEAAAAVCSEPGLLQALGQMLDPGEAAAAMADPAVAATPAGAADVEGAEQAAAAAAVEAVVAVAAGGKGAAPGAAGSAGLLLQVWALRALRLLAQASRQCAQAVRATGAVSAGQLQAYIVLADGCSGGAGGSSAGSSAIMLELLRLEALRTWRVYVHHAPGPAPLLSMDEMYPHLCKLLQPTGGSVSVSSSSALQQLACAEAYCLLAALVKHAVAVERGNATAAGGSSMISPGAAAALAPEALQWLQPSVLSAVAAAAVSRHAQAAPMLPERIGGGSSSASLLRTLLGAHPALLLPPAATHVVALSAAVNFLAVYWATVAPGQDVFGQVQSALGSSGLLQPASSGPPLPSAAAQCATADDELAMLLLLQPAQPPATAPGAGAGGAQATIGRALTRWALRLLQPSTGSLATAAAAAGHKLVSTARQSSITALLAHICLQVAAAALLHSTLQLAASVYRQDAAAPPAPSPTSPSPLAGAAPQEATHGSVHGVSSSSGPADHGADAATAATPGAGAAGGLSLEVQAGSLARQLALALAPALHRSALAAPAMCTRVLCPWHAAALAPLLHYSRALLLAAEICQRGASGAGGSGPSAGAAGAAVSDETANERSRVEAAVTDSCLGVLSFAVPGAEEVCLRAVRLALSPEAVGGLMGRAWAAVQRLPAVNPRLADAAGGVRYSGSSGGQDASAPEPWASASASAAAEPPYPAPSAPLSGRVAADTLLESYAASWLSLISKRHLDPHPDAGSDPEGDHGDTHPGSAAVEDVGGGGGGADCEGGRGPNADDGSARGAAASGSNGARKSVRFTDDTAGGREGDGGAAGSGSGGAGAGGRGSRKGGGGGLPGSPLSLVGCQLQGQAGSRLPAPSQWMMLEAHHVPQARLGLARRRPQAAAGAAAALAPAQGPLPGLSLHAVGCALMLALGLQEAGSELLARQPAGIKMRAALQAAYLFNANELMPRVASADGDGDDDDEEQMASWRNPDVRWALAGLTQVLMCMGDAAVPPTAPSWLAPGLAEQLSEALACRSFGDPLMACHVAAALLPQSGPLAAQQVWSALGMEKALHLLPPAHACLGGRAAYLAPGLAGGGAGADGVALRDGGFVALMVRSLCDGELDKALEGEGLLQGGAGSGSGAARPIDTARLSLSADLALNVIASHVLDRRRWARVFGAPAPTAPAPQAPPQGQHGGGCAASAAGSSGSSQAVAGASGPYLAALLVRSVRPELLAQLLLLAEAGCTLARGDAAAVLVQACGGAAEQLERCRHALALVGL